MGVVPHQAPPVGVLEERLGIAGVAAHHAPERARPRHLAAVHRHLVGPDRLQRTGQREDLPEELFPEPTVQAREKAAEGAVVRLEPSHQEPVALVVAAVLLELALRAHAVAHPVEHDRQEPLGRVRRASPVRVGPVQRREVHAGQSQQDPARKVVLRQAGAERLGEQRRRPLFPKGGRAQARTRARLLRTGSVEQRGLFHGRKRRITDPRRSKMTKT
jgi:hypothetical protein